MKTKDILEPGQRAHMGAPIYITVECYDDDGAYADPTALTVHVQPFGQDAVTYYWSVEGQADSPEITRTEGEADGVFSVRHVVAHEADHQVRVEPQGNVEAIAQGMFPVVESNIE